MELDEKKYGCVGRELFFFVLNTDTTISTSGVLEMEQKRPAGWLPPAFCLLGCVGQPHVAGRDVGLGPPRS